MRHVSDWTLPDGSLLLNFSDEVRGVFERNVQVGDLPESGGVLPDGASVIVMLGSDKANKTLEQMGAPTTTIAGVATTLPPVGGDTTTTTG